MKALVWAGFLVLMAFWTGLVAITEQLSRWLLSSTANGQVNELATQAGQWPVPAWLGLWVDTAEIKSLQEASVGLVQWLGQILPSTAGLMDWITPLLWLGWGFGALILLMCAAAGHWLLSRRPTEPRQLNKS